MTSSVLAELLAYTQAHAGRHSARLNEFIPAYFDNADPGEITARGPQTLYAIATAHWRLLEAARSPDTARIRVFNPTLAEDGYVSDHTVIQIVHADMPFLVDSVTMAVNRGGRTAHWIVHPLMAVQRDDKGLAMRIGRVPADRNKRQQAGIESWSHATGSSPNRTAMNWPPNSSGCWVTCATRCRTGSPCWLALTRSASRRRVPL